MKAFFYWIPSFTIAIVIFLFSSRQRISVSEEFVLNFVFFKSLHIIEYAVFCFFNYRAVFNTLTSNKSKAAIISFLITVIYALSDEIHQTFVPTREGKLRDIGFDTIGAALAILLVWKLLPKAKGKLLNWVKILEVT